LLGVYLWRLWLCIWKLYCGDEILKLKITQREIEIERERERERERDIDR
jgi:hypothetical protein